MRESRDAYEAALEASRALSEWVRTADDRLRVMELRVYLAPTPTSDAATERRTLVAFELRDLLDDQPPEVTAEFRRVTGRERAEQLRWARAIAAGAHIAWSVVIVSGVLLTPLAYYNGKMARLADAGVFTHWLVGWVVIVAELALLAGAAVAVSAYYLRAASGNPDSTSTPLR
jgi:hypothetical protein